MKTKNFLTHIIVLIIGLTAGWFLFKSDEHPVSQPAGVVAQEFTCSMHPQIRQNGPGKCPLCGMELIPISAASDEDNPYLHHLTETDVVAAGIRTTKVRRASESGEISLTGKVQINPGRITAITAKFPGRIERLFIQAEGQTVQAGDRLALIYSPDLITAQRELLEARKLLSNAPELYQAAREKLRLWRISDRQIDAIEASGKPIETVELFADVSGVLTRRPVNAGDYVTTGSTLIEVTSLNTLWVVLDAYETDLPLLQRGTTLSFTTPALPDRKFTASVTQISPVINEQTRTAQVRAEVNNDGMLLKPEMLVNATVRINLSGRTNALVIPASSVLWTGKRSVVYVKHDVSKPTFEMREVTLGNKVNNLYIVENGLEEGEEVVQDGAFAIDASAQLSGNFSMMNRPEQSAPHTSLKFREQFSGILNAYFSVKNALVASDTKKAAEAAVELSKAIQRADYTFAEKEKQHQWSNLKNNAFSFAGRIRSSEKLDEQRKTFNALSDALIEAVEQFGAGKGKIWKAYCPMAFDDAGAYWLSEFEEIKNPYFGASMLRCGVNKATFIGM
ncbi:MAG: efflux RND transporter periplasmic adaptor subunit [Cyclobacteriaceae bacterium]|nr:efflux RND transporter periplasmic adaptor subunit [Cyclobacteriaceae bacterium]